MSKTFAIGQNLISLVCPIAQVYIVWIVAQQVIGLIGKTSFEFGLLCSKKKTTWCAPILLTCRWLSGYFIFRQMDWYKGTLSMTTEIPRSHFIRLFSKGLFDKQGCWLISPEIIGNFQNQFQLRLWCCQIVNKNILNIYWNIIY